MSLAAPAAAVHAHHDEARIRAGVQGAGCQAPPPAVGLPAAAAAPWAHQVQMPPPPQGNGLVFWPLDAGRHRATNSNAPQQGRLRFRAFNGILDSANEASDPGEEELTGRRGTDDSEEELWSRPLKRRRGTGGA